MAVIINGEVFEPVNKAEGSVKICVLQRGWAFVGYFERNGNDCKLTKASCIRRWGTTKGLGELVGGPTKDTVLDFAGTVQFDYLTCVLTLDCKEVIWKENL